MVKCSGTDHSIALEVQTLKQTSLLMSSASGKIFSQSSSRDKYSWEMWLMHPKAGGFPFSRSPSPSLLPLSKPSGEGVTAQSPHDMCPKQGRSINLMGWDLGHVETSRFSASKGCQGSLAGEPKPGRLWEATGGLFATWYISNGRAA